MDGRTLLLLAGQAGLAILVFEILRRRVFPSLAASPVGAPSAVGDVWGPLVLVGPGLFLTAQGGPSVAGAAWAGIGGPVLVGLVAVSLALRSRSRAGAEEPLARQGRLAMAAAATGLLLLLLGGAHDLTIWTGQCTFAVAAVLLWMNTPTVGHRSSAEVPPMAGGGLAAEWWVLAAATGAMGQGICTLFVPETGARASVAIVVIYATVAAACAVRVAGPGWGVRLGGWSAVLGTLLAIGTLSLRHLAPQTLSIVTGRQATVTPLVAHGFGRYALEATILLVVPALALGLRRVDPPARRLLGTALLAAAVVIGVWRIAGI